MPPPSPLPVSPDLSSLVREVNNLKQLEFLHQTSFSLFLILQKGTVVIQVSPSSFVVKMSAGLGAVGKTRTRKKTTTGRTRQEDSEDGGFTRSSSHGQIVE